MSNATSHKRLAKNTIALYIRSLLSVVIGLYTSRVVINTLGVDDYGVYGVVGGFVGMLSFINAAMSGATSRFITYEMGLGNVERTKSTFANAMTVHIGIAALIIIVCEAVGVWFINTQLNIPAESMTAANWVFQLSVLTAAVTITQVPYTALIISHEKMGVYAYMEIINVTLKLAIVYFLLVIPGDKLIIYAVLTAIVGVGIAMAYRIYCLRHFVESRTRPKYERTIFKPMLAFSVWDLFGNMCYTGRTQGTTFILNIFFGVAINGAASIAAVINSTISGFSNNVVTAVRPQIIKNYAQKSWEGFQHLIEFGSQAGTLLLAVIAIPLFIEMPYIYQLWLGEVPEFVVIFTRIILINVVFAQLNIILGIGIHATGQIKLISFMSGSFYLLALPVMYVFLYNNYGPATAFYVNLGSTATVFVSNMWILKHNAQEFSCKSYMLKIILLGLMCILPALISLALHYNIESRMLRLVLEIAVTTGILGISAYAFILTEPQREKIKAKLKIFHNRG